jgi:citrate lyase gamma subunit
MGRIKDRKETPWTLITMESVGEFKFHAPLNFLIEMNDDGLYISQTNYMHGFGKDLDAAIEDLLVNLRMMWEEIVLADKQSLDFGARCMRERLLAVMDRIEG